MNGYAQLAYRLLGPVGEKAAARDPALQKKLLKAHVPMRAGAYNATLYLTAGVAAVWLGLMGALLALVVPGTPAALKLLVPFAMALFAGGMVVAIGPLLLENTVREREKEIDENLAHGLNYMLALANAGLPPKEIWRSLARAEVFGALAVEADRVARDLDLFGHDILRALRAAQERTASKRFHEFLQGAISAFQSGVELESYLKTKGAQYQHEAVEKQLQDLDTMGVMAEAFLVVVVAAPLFLIILLTVMAVNQGASVIAYGFMLTLLAIPVMQTVMGAVIQGLNPKVWT